MASMTSDPAVVHIDPGDVGVTAVHYVTGWHSPLRPFIWERLVGEEWRLIDPLEDRVIDPPPSDPGQEGTFLQELRPGQAYQVRMYHDESVDPNQVDVEGPDAEAKAVGLLRGPEPSELITGEEKGPGGTFFAWSVTTAVDTLAFLQISTKAPSTDSEGVLSFDSILASDTDGTLRQTHSLEVASQDLLPGNPFHALLLVLDAEGNWQIEHHRFTTRKRRVKVGFDEVHVINDGAPGHNEARFSHWILQGNRLRSLCMVPEQEITDRPSPGEGSMEHIPLGPICGPPMFFGPEKITSANRRMAILTRGVAGGDKSGNFLPGPAPNPPSDEFSGTIFQKALFTFPIGSRDEAVDEQPFQVVAHPFVEGNEFMYSVRVFVSVDYF
jgi:hypothetical protein